MKLLHTTFWIVILISTIRLNATLFTEFCNKIQSHLKKCLFQISREPCTRTLHENISKHTAVISILQMLRTHFFVAGPINYLTGLPTIHRCLARAIFASLTTHKNVLTFSVAANTENAGHLWACKQRLVHRKSWGSFCNFLTWIRYRRAALPLRFGIHYYYTKQSVRIHKVRPAQGVKQIHSLVLSVPSPEVID